MNDNEKVHKRRPSSSERVNSEVTSENRRQAKTEDVTLHFRTQDNQVERRLGSGKFKYNAGTKPVTHENSVT